ncbi:MAG: hypothetical protein J7L23_03905 [Candidatus Diapherotrites archaeon]|nr:hypothetical protein [Candidatus Diapherotrites archaeon]
MLQYVFSPKWFYGVDIIFEIFSILVCFLIAYYANKFFKVSHERKHRYFSVIFLLIGVAFIFKILTNFTIYYHVLRVIQIGSTLHFVNYQYKSEIIYSIGYFLFRLLMIGAFSSLYLITQKEKSRNLVYLLFYFILLTTFFSYYIFVVFHITMAILLFMLVGYYYHHYKQKGESSTKVIVFSFAVLLLSQVFFLLTIIHLDMYVIGEFLQLVGYLLLLYDFFMVNKS